MPEDTGEAQCHGFGARRVAHNQVRDGVQRIEKEMRVDLRPEGAQFGFGDLLQQDSLAAAALDSLPLQP